jgi:hypothetical protein
LASGAGVPHDGVFSEESARDRLPADA